MKEIRQRILNILKERGQTTLTDLARALNRPPVSVRHHLDILQEQGFVRKAGVQRRSTRGRPRHVYVLTEEAHLLFPHNYRELANELLRELKRSLPKEKVAAFFQRLAAEMATGVSSEPLRSLEERLTVATRFLSEKGYLARWERRDGGGYLLHVFNCPYDGLSAEHGELCQMDLLFVGRLLDLTPRRITHAAGGDYRCTYLIEGEASEKEKGAEDA